MNKIFSVFFLALIAISSFACKDIGRTLSKKSVTGKAGEVIVVADKNVWETEPGIELRKVLASDYPALPQREPAYNLIQISENAFSNLFKAHRNIIIFGVDAKYTEATMKTVEDVWAAPQTVIYFTGPNMASIAKLIKDNNSVLFNTFGQAERNRIINNSKKYEERALRSVVADAFGGSPYFPNGYSLKKKTKDFIWISYETTYVNQGILIYSIPIKDTNSLKLEPFIESCNEVLKNNVPGMFENSYMTTSSQFKPIMNWMRYKNRQFAEVRGLWEVENDFMGGPFVIHAFYSKDNKSIIVVEGFVYAPKYPKRNYLRHIESIIYSWEWAKNAN